MMAKNPAPAPSRGLLSDKSIFEMFGFNYVRSTLPRVCWCCGETIPPDNRHYTFSGKLDGKMFSVRHCRERCEIVSEILDQNPHLRPAVFSETLPKWIDAERAAGRLPA